MAQTPQPGPFPVALPDTVRPPQPIRFAASVLLALMAFAWSVFCTYRLYHQEWSSEAAGYCIGTLLLPFVGAYAIAGAKRRRNGLRFALWFLGFTVLCTASSLIHSHKGLSDLPAGEMVKTMAGTMPLPADASENDRQTVAATKQLFADLNQISTSYDQKQAALTPELNKIYTAGAFANRASIKHMQDIVQQKLAIDHEVSTHVQQLPALVEASFKKSSLSEIQKQEFMNGFAKGITGSDVMKARQQMLTAEENWASATTDLYDFALAHSSQIVVSSNAIHIGSPDVRTQFNAKFNHAKQERDTFNASVRNLVAVRQAELKAKNLTPQDMGLSK